MERWEFRWTINFGNLRPRLHRSRRRYAAFRAPSSAWWPRMQAAALPRSAFTHSSLTSSARTTAHPHQLRLRRGWTHRSLWTTSQAQYCMNPGSRTVSCLPARSFRGCWLPCKRSATRTHEPTHRLPIGHPSVINTHDVSRMKKAANCALVACTHPETLLGRCIVNIPIHIAGSHTQLSYFCRLMKYAVTLRMRVDSARLSSKSRAMLTRQRH